MYSVLATGWRCQCSDANPPHHTNLLLEKRIESEGNELDTPDRQLSVLFSLRTGSGNFSLSWQETEVKVLESKGCQVLPLNPTLEASTAAILSDATNRFKETGPNYLHPFKKSPKKAPFPHFSFQETKAPAVQDLVEIADLCKVVRNAHCGTLKGPLGYLSDRQDRRHAFYPSIEPTRFSENAETVTLSSLLSKSTSGSDLHQTSTMRTISMTLSRLERYSIAVTLASSLLQLSRSPWIEETWSKNDIHFYVAAEGSPRPIVVDKPYVTRKFSSNSPQSSMTSVTEQTGRKDSTKSIQALGIMLLELCFGEAIQDQSVRSEYLTNGQPNDMTDFCTAHHWWQHDALGEGGLEYCEAIRRCLFCAFGPRSTDLDDDELRAAIYNEVVEPLGALENALRRSD